VKHLDAENVRVLILSAGKIDNELEKIFGKIPSGLIPINGKPVIFRIIKKFSLNIFIIYRILLSLFILAVVYL